MPTTETRLLLLRHGEVASHRGDVPVTEAGLEHAERSGKALGAGTHRPDHRAVRRHPSHPRDRRGARSAASATTSRVDGPIDSFALRNPDMYVAGTRVNMVSSPAALAEQVPGMTPEQVEATRGGWSSSPHRTASAGGSSQDDPPGENVEQLTARILHLRPQRRRPGPAAGAHRRRGHPLAAAARGAAARHRQ